MLDTLIERTYETMTTSKVKARHALMWQNEDAFVGS